MFSINDMFALGMKRVIPVLEKPDHTRAVNLGAGISHIKGVRSIDFPEWDAECGHLPPDMRHLTAVYAFHFFEHLPGKVVIELLRDIQDRLVSGGTLNIVVPYYKSGMAAHDLDHKSQYNEDTWKTLFSTPYYAKNREREWKFDIGTNVIIGVVERNLALMTQLIKK
ncbi:methyltransferase [Burkholderia phage vB_BglM_WTB]